MRRGPGRHMCLPAGSCMHDPEHGRTCAAMPVGACADWNNITAAQGSSGCGRRSSGAASRCRAGSLLSEQACECAMGICTPVLCESRLHAGLGRFTSECHRAYDFAVTPREPTGRLCVRPIGTIRALCAFVSLCISRTCDAARSNLPLHALRALLGRFVFCVTFACRRLASLTAFGFFLARGQLANIYLCRYFAIWSFGWTRLAEEVGGLGVEYDSTAVGRDGGLLAFLVGRYSFGSAGAIELCRLSCARPRAGRGGIRL